MAKTLKSFARKQATEEKNETESTVAETPETTQETPAEEEAPAEEESEEMEEESGESTEDESDEDAESETETPPAGPGASAAALPPGHVGVNAADLKVLQEKAGKWDANEGEYNTLKSWYANTIQIGASAKEDVSTQREKKSSTVASQPWNKAAIELAESL